MNPKKVVREKTKKLTDLPNIGKSLQRIWNLSVSTFLKNSKGKIRMNSIKSSVKSRE